LIIDVFVGGATAVKVIVAAPLSEVAVPPAMAAFKVTVQASFAPIAFRFVQDTLPTPLPAVTVVTLTFAGS
jgi:hypothetical protein